MLWPALELGGMANEKVGVFLERLRADGNSWYMMGMASQPRLCPVHLPRCTITPSSAPSPHRVML